MNFFLFFLVSLNTIISTSLLWNRRYLVLVEHFSDIYSILQSLLINNNMNQHVS